ncbi:hypothetical protein OSCI_3080007 [Kamptonema sp. PCC 6506]|nr:hypothetical protein OSCI_3080007 [Kamptonema sp. PCC 6506]
MEAIAPRSASYWRIQVDCCTLCTQGLPTYYVKYHQFIIVQP